ncbi:MAG TPA: diguanylate cyclase [Burkholderiaceae bacterium]
MPLTLALPRAARTFRAGFVAGICLLVLDAAIPLYLTQQVAHTRVQAEALEHAGDHLNELLSALKDTETGQRGYMLTGLSEYLEPYRTGRAQASRLLAQLEGELPFVDYGDALRTLADLERKQAEFQLERIESRGGAFVEDLAASARGKKLMDAVRAQSAALSARLSAQRDRYQDHAATLDRWSRYAITVVTLINIFLLVGLYLLSKRAHAARDAAGAALATAHGPLTEQITARNQALADLERQAGRLRDVVATQAELAQAGFDARAFMRQVAERMLDLTPGSGCVVELVDDAEMVYEAGAGTLAPFEGMRIKRVGSLSGLCVFEQQLLYCRDAREDTRVDRAACQKVGVLSMIVAPLMKGGEAAGVLKVSAAEADAFGDDDVQTLLLMAGMLGAGLAKQLQFERIGALLDERESTLNSLKLELRRREEADSALAHNRARTQAIIEGSQEAFVCVDKYCIVRDWNREAERTFGWLRHEALGRSVENLIIPERYRDKLSRGITRYITTGESASIGRRFELIALTRTGAEIPIEITISVLRHEDDVEFPCFLHDISARKRAEAALRTQDDMLRGIADNLPVLVAFVDAQGRYRYCNGEYRKMLGGDPTGKTMREAFGNTDYATVEAFIDDALHGISSTFETQIDQAGGRRFVEGNFISHKNADGGIDGFYIVAWDIHDRKQKELQWQTRASVDPLTGLINRSYFLEALEQASLRHKRSGEALAVLYLDIDHFKDVNDTHGHAAGDYLLREFAQHLKDAVREADVVCRLGGDEFCVLLENVRGEANAVAVAEKILQIAGRALSYEGAVLRVSTSIGIAYAAQPHAAGEQLLRLADGALYKAKQWGRNQYSLYVVTVEDGQAAVAR